MLRTILARVEADELTASSRVVARLEGAATALEAVAQPTRGAVGYRAPDPISVWPVDPGGPAQRVP